MPTGIDNTEVPQHAPTCELCGNVMLPSMPRVNQDIGVPCERVPEWVCQDCHVSLPRVMAESQWDIVFGLLEAGVL